MTLDTDKEGITHYWPEDDEWTMYVQSGTKTLGNLVDAAMDKWPDQPYYGVTVTVEHIKTGHVGDIVVDCESDFTCFIVLSVQQDLEKE